MAIFKKKPTQRVDEQVQSIIFTSSEIKSFEAKERQIISMNFLSTRKSTVHNFKNICYLGFGPCSFTLHLIITFSKNFV